MAVSKELLAKAANRVLLGGGQVGGNIKFDKIEIRINDGSNIIVEGDEFTIPKGQDLEDSKFIRVFNGNQAPGIFVITKDGSLKEFYLSTFTKMAIPYNEDSTRVKNADGSDAPAIISTGTAVDLWKKYTIAEDGLQAIAGKTLKYSKVDAIRTMRLRNNGARVLGNSQIPTIDIVK